MSRISAVKGKVSELVDESKELYSLGLDLEKSREETVRKKLMIEYQKWYREAYAILDHNDSSGLDEFEEAYDEVVSYIKNYGSKDFTLRMLLSEKNASEDFKKALDLQVAFLLSLPNELEAYRYSYMKEVSADFSLSELDQAKILLDSGFESAAGVVARVALEGFIRTIFKVNINESSIPKFDKCITELKRQGIIEERHRKHLADLYGLGSECAHPSSTITKKEVQRLINETREMIRTLK